MQQHEELCSKGSAFQKQQADTTKLVNLVFSQDAARRSQIKVIQSHEQMVPLFLQGEINGRVEAECLAKAQLLCQLLQSQQQ